jgi:hypothetical protein
MNDDDLEPPPHGDPSTPKKRNPRSRPGIRDDGRPRRGERSSAKPRKDAKEELASKDAEIDKLKKQLQRLADTVEYQGFKYDKGKDGKPKGTAYCPICEPKTGLLFHLNRIADFDVCPNCNAQFRARSPLESSDDLASFWRLGRGGFCSVTTINECFHALGRGFFHTIIFYGSRKSPHNLRRAAQSPSFAPTHSPRQTWRSWRGCCASHRLNKDSAFEHLSADAVRVMVHIAYCGSKSFRARERWPCTVQSL